MSYVLSVLTPEIRGRNETPELVIGDIHEAQSVFTEDPSDALSKDFTANSTQPA